MIEFAVFMLFSYEVAAFERLCDETPPPAGFMGEVQHPELMHCLLSSVCAGCCLRGF